MIKMYGMGRLGADPELKSTRDGKPVCNMRVAFDFGYGASKGTAWLSCSVWGKSGEAAASLLSKGSQVIIDGELRQREYTDRDGQNRTVYEVSVTDWRMCGPRADSAAAPSGGDAWGEPATPKKKPTTWGGAGGDDSDPIPF